MADGGETKAECASRRDRPVQGRSLYTVSRLVPERCFD